MKDTENVSFDSMTPLIRGSFLTKEQAEKLKEPFKDVVSVVRCKGCKYMGSPDGYYEYCNHLQKFVTGDWFCADGERKEGR